MYNYDHDEDNWTRNHPNWALERHISGTHSTCLGPGLDSVQDPCWRGHIELLQEKKHAHFCCRDGRTFRYLNDIITCSSHFSPPMHRGSECHSLKHCSRQLLRFCTVYGSLMFPVWFPLSIRSLYLFDHTRACDNLMLCFEHCKARSAALKHGGPRTQKQNHEHILPKDQMHVRPTEQNNRWPER